MRYMYSGQGLLLGGVCAVWAFFFSSWEGQRGEEHGSRAGMREQVPADGRLSYSACSACLLACLLALRYRRQPFSRRSKGWIAWLSKSADRPPALLIFPLLGRELVTGYTCMYTSTTASVTVTILQVDFKAFFQVALNMIAGPIPSPGNVYRVEQEREQERNARSVDIKVNI